MESTFAKHVLFVRELLKVFFLFVFACSEGLGEAYDGDIAFASALETFGGGHNDPISVAFGGMSICHHKEYQTLVIFFSSCFIGGCIGVTQVHPILFHSDQI